MTPRSLLFLLTLVPATAAAQGAPLTLRDAVALGRSRGVQGEVARYAARAAEARAGQRRADLLPEIAASAAVSRQTNNLTEFGLAIPGFPAVTDPFTLYALRARATQTIFSGAELARDRGATADAHAAGYDATAAADLAGLNAGLAWLRAVSAEETVRAREADSTVAASLLQMAREQLQAGTSAAIDVTRAEVNSAANRGQLVAARNARAQSRLELARALYLPADTVLVLADSLDASTVDLPADAEAAVAFALAHRPEMAAERERTRALSLQRSAVVWENLPSVAGFGQVNESGVADDELHYSWSVGVQVSIPIFDGLRRQRRASEQSAKLDAQTVRERDLRSQVEVEARSALLDLTSAREGVEVAAERLRLAEQELRQSEERFRAGAAGSVETTQAQLGLFAARDGLIQSKVNLGSAKVRAYRALGALDQLK
ncbi:MAG TPA: TolC family protein [Gemmatimonadales bacterium]|nr:TolC family protein [Gemmatimonadales bacterium]